MLFHEGRDEVIGMIIALLQAQLAFLLLRSHGLGKVLRTKEVIELIIGARVDQHWPVKTLALHQQGRVMRPPLFLVPPICLLYTSPSPRDRQKSRMPSSA